MSARLPPELTVGFEELDRQHRRMIDLMNAATAAARTGDLAAVRAAVASLGDELVTHFSSEEGFMAEALYPDRARHKAAHDLFLQDFAQLGKELEAGLSDLAVHWLTIRVPEWVKFHIGVNDVPLGQYLTARHFRPEQPRSTDAKSRPS